MYYRVNKNGTILDWSYGDKPYCEECFYSDKSVVRGWNGSMYLEGEELEEPQERVQARIQKQLTDAVQRVLDNKARELNYDSCLSVCSYINTKIAKFDSEGEAFRVWRSAVWAKGYEILELVKSGKMAIPSEEELIAMLPELVIEYTE